MPIASARLGLGLGGTGSSFNLAEVQRNLSGDGFCKVADWLDTGVFLNVMLQSRHILGDNIQTNYAEQIAELMALICALHFFFTNGEFANVHRLLVTFTWNILSSTPLEATWPN